MSGLRRPVADVEIHHLCETRVDSVIEAFRNQVRTICLYFMTRTSGSPTRLTVCM
jgi:hypothetical protein